MRLPCFKGVVLYPQIGVFAGLACQPPGADGVASDEGRDIGQVAFAGGVALERIASAQGRAAVDRVFPEHRLADRVERLGDLRIGQGAVRQEDALRLVGIDQPELLHRPVGDLQSPTKAVAVGRSPVPDQVVVSGLDRTGKGDLLRLGLSGHVADEAVVISLRHLRRGAGLDRPRLRRVGEFVRIGEVFGKPVGAPVLDLVGRCQRTHRLRQPGMEPVPVFRSCVRCRNAQAFALLPFQLGIGCENPVEAFRLGPALGFSELAVAFGKTVKPALAGRRDGPVVPGGRWPCKVARRWRRHHGPGVCQICHEKDSFLLFPDGNEHWPVQPGVLLDC